MFKIAVYLISCTLLFGNLCGSDKIGVVPHRNSLEKESTYKPKEFKKYYNVGKIKTLSGLDTPQLDIKIVISCGDEFVIEEHTSRVFDIHNNKIKTSSDVPVSSVLLGDDKTEYSNLLTIEDGVDGHMYQFDDEIGWFMQESNPFNIYSRFDDFSFESLCGKMWYLDSDTGSEVILTRSIENGINSDFIHTTYMSLFSEKELNFTRHESNVVLDKKSNRFKSYVESVSFITGKLGSEPIFTADDGLWDYEQVEYKVTVTIDLIQDSDEVIYLPSEEVIQDDIILDSEGVVEDD